jgi:hypothetical protein
MMRSKLLGCQVEERGIVEHAGVVDQHVDAAVRGERGGDRFAHVRGFAYIAGNEGGLGSGLGDSLRPCSGLARC